jgi:hypothetical protein
VQDTPAAGRIARWDDFAVLFSLLAMRAALAVRQDPCTPYQRIMLAE